MARLPSGTVTFMFSDIEGSTNLLNRLGAAYTAVLERQQQLMRAAIAQHGGVEVMTEGDSFFVVFASAPSALAAALAAQRSFSCERWPGDAAVRVRMGLHTGEGLFGGDNYVGLDVHRAARIAAAGHGGQVLISDATRALTQDSLVDGVELIDLGQHRLKDLPRPERIYQLVVEDLPSIFPAIRSLDSRPNNLPAPITSFVGREAQIEEISRLLEETRLLTLLGPGGTGKTRLGIRVAEELLGRYEHGCWFVALDALRDPSLVPAAIADALEVKAAGDQPVFEALAGWLAQRELLLMLDNFEQLSEAAPAIGQLLARAPRVRVLATSRIPLHLYGEREYAVPPLGRASDLRAAAESSAEAVSQYEAVQLFIERAVAVKLDFRVTNRNAPAVAELCARLDGLPLAIELAAARVKLLTPEQILVRLGGSLSLLASTAQDLPERQRTLRGAIDWSHDLLSEAEQRLFARLSAFMGGFTLEAAEAVCAEGLTADVFDGLASLVDKSLLRSFEQDGATRFALLETIREYAAERLAGTDEEQEIMGRHARHFLELAVESEPHLGGDDQVEWLDRLEREHDNLRFAFDRAPDLGLLDAALLAAGSAWRFWHQRAHFAEARSILERLLARPGAAPGARAKALIGAGGIAYWQNDYQATEAYYREAGELYESIGDDAGTAEALFNQSYVPMLRGDSAGGRELAQRAAEMYRRSGDELGQATAENVVAFTHYLEGRTEAAIPLLERAVARYRLLGARLQLAETVGGLGYMYAVTGDWQVAMQRLHESLALLRETGNEVGLAMVLEMGAAMAAQVGDPERAAALFGATEDWKERLGGGVPAELSQTHRHRATAVELLGEQRFAELHADGARMPVEQAIALFEDFHPPPDAPPAMGRQLEPDSG